MYKCTNKVTINEEGYTLLESLFQLIVFILFSKLFILLIVWTTNFQGLALSKEQTEWELFINDVLSYLATGQNIEVINTGHGFRMDYEEKVVDIEQFNEIVRKRIDNQGHEPMLLGIKKMTVKKNSSSLTIHVEFLNGLQKERELYVATKS